MIGFLKVFGKGVLYTILFPFIILIWVLFTIYCIGLFIYQFFKSVILWIKGDSPFADTKEDIEAKRVLLERQNQTSATQQSDQYKDALIASLANAVVQQQQQMQQQEKNQPNELPPYDALPTEEIEHEEIAEIEQFVDEGENQ